MSQSMNPTQHWETVYRNKAVDQVSWFQPHAETSRRLIESLCPDPAARSIDVGAGASKKKGALMISKFL
jgi:hypothetical protein